MFDLAITTNTCKQNFMANVSSEKRPLEMQYTYATQTPQQHWSGVHGVQLIRGIIMPSTPSSRSPPTLPRVRSSASVSVSVSAISKHWQISICSTHLVQDCNKLRRVSSSSCTNMSTNTHSSTTLAALITNSKEFINFCFPELCTQSLK